MTGDEFGHKQHCNRSTWAGWFWFWWHNLILVRLIWNLLCNPGQLLASFRLMILWSCFSLQSAGIIGVCHRDSFVRSAAVLESHRYLKVKSGKHSEPSTGSPYKVQRGLFSDPSAQPQVSFFASLTYLVWWSSSDHHSIVFLDEFTSCELSATRNCIWWRILPSLLLWVTDCTVVTLGPSHSILTCTFEFLLLNISCWLSWMHSTLIPCTSPFQKKKWKRLVLHLLFFSKY